jgi:agmatinase
VQVGIRASAHDRAHWEGTLGVHQIRPDEVERRGVDVLAEEIVAHFRRLGVDTVYVSNDIDGTDERWAAATGTPEPGGLEPEFVRGLTSRVLDAFPLAGADLVEVAPGLGHDRPGEPARTLETAADYLEDLVAAALR